MNWVCWHSIVKTNLRSTQSTRGILRVWRYWSFGYDQIYKGETKGSWKDMVVGDLIGVKEKREGKSHKMGLDDC